ncbi:bifunctional tetrahydrofolate synthase/dihydrofolate synthase [Usitatibacter palustris]|uniref:Dihydrofolate synthase/folylpolyglutamate synthase n=1 Tax=Usitatibacter palustris TaxID=2732487 RepID=A0A6M4H4W1_9PROT|nr:bifunctional tetrahydrofolate synthase/dihydrofolate synthase [Usitatibacter palustris]QJR14681.1 Dihydrofolate synthase/folylpolyglutamate synthase [Usitatibacter palustris]
MQRSLDDWLAYISAQHPSAIALGLDRVREVAGRMQLKPPKVAITVGGTNGKGSTCAFLERILLECGYKVGCYTSPHLIRYNERVRLQGEDVADAPLVESFERVEAARGSTQLTYFEYGTLAALWLFNERNVDCAILEVGLGGRLDAVNIIDADVAIVTSVDLDHQAFLGNTREAIGAEKAGIFRKGRPALFGDVGPPESLVKHAQAIGADLQILGRDFGFALQERQWEFRGRRSKKHALPVPALRGTWQLKNASCAIAALDEVADRLPVSLGEIKRGLTLVRLTGRLQVLPGQPAVVLDVAHNPHAARSLADGLLDMGFYPRTIAVFAMLADKDIGAVIDALKGRIDEWFVASVASDRAASATQLTEALAARGYAGVTRSFATVAQALDAARREAAPNDRICVFGSFYTVAEALEASR